MSVPGRNTLRYGGNTTCVEIRSGKDIVILDAGTGLRVLGQSLLKEFQQQPLQLTLLLTHLHWDHIQGIPLFGPIYRPQCQLKIIGAQGITEALARQMADPYFPVPISQLSGRIQFEELKSFDFKVGGMSVRAQRANHPGMTLGYQLSTPGARIVFFPDAEPLRDAGNRQLVEFVRGADVLILDSQYDAAEYQDHIGWGHGCVDDSVAIAMEAGVKRLILFHHDPDHDDRKIDAFVRHARQLAARKKSKLKIEAAREGKTLSFPR